MSRKRKHDLAALGVVLLLAMALFLPWLMYEVLDAASIGWCVLAARLAVLDVIAAVYVRLWFYRCPYCEKTAGQRGWKVGRRYYCPHCGQPFLFGKDLEEQS